MYGRQNMHQLIAKALGHRHKYQKQPDEEDQIDLKTKPITITANKIILTCFAGRRSCMSILMKYVHLLLEKDSIQEFHAWNFTRCDEDNVWVKSLHDPSKGIYVMPVANRERWREYYKYYTPASFVNCVIVKTDDDIVYVDTEGFDAFITSRKRFPGFALLFPSIVNNEMCAHYQQGRGMIPLSVGQMKLEPQGFGGLWADGVETQRLHTHFLEQGATKFQSKGDFDIVPINDRISINFFAILSKDLDIFQMVGIDDEGELTQEIPGKVRRPLGICYDLVVSHLAFFKQRENGLNVDPLLTKYMQLADEQS